MNFVKTDDEETRRLLEKEGFQFLHKEGKYYVFINDINKKFDYKSKVLFTNKLAM